MVWRDSDDPTDLGGFLYYTRFGIYLAGVSACVLYKFFYARLFASLFPTSLFPRLALSSIRWEPPAFTLHAWTYAELAVEALGPENPLKASSHPFAFRT